MEFLKEYRQTRDNYKDLGLIEKFIIWMRFKITPIKELLKLIPSHGKMLDLGCGFGVFSHFLAKKFSDLKILAIDPSQNRIGTAKNTHVIPQNLLFKYGRIEEINENNFDAILLNDVIFALSREDLEKMLQCCYLKTKKDGVLIIKDMSRDHFLKYLFTVIPAFFLTKSSILFQKFFSGKSISKIIGSRKSTPKFYRAKELKSLLEANNWRVDIYDVADRFLVYPNIIYFCRK
jgi:2-polyprenyl-3-methyl-5-hydroxy-6-metoxy-1,4-benzoquinol methylase